MFSLYFGAKNWRTRSVAQWWSSAYAVRAVPNPRCHFAKIIQSCYNRWKGLPDGATRSGLGALEREKHDRERSLDKKKEQLAELLVQQIAFRNLARRNRLNSTASPGAVGEGGADGDGLGCEAEQDADDLAASKVSLACVHMSAYVCRDVSCYGLRVVGGCYIWILR